MYTLRYALVSLLLCFFGLSKMEGQGVSEVDFLIQYNPETCLYEACIVIVSGTSTSIPDRVQFNSQYTIVTPTGTTISIDTLLNPLEGNAFYTGTIPCLWEFGPKEIAPPAAPGLDFHSVSANLSPPSYYNNLEVGDTVRLFGFSVDNISPNCGIEVRPFENGVDPSSIDMPSGGDFNNGFTIGGPNQDYRANIETVQPPLPEIEWDIVCNGDATINVSPVDSLICQYPYTYTWTGPGGFFSTDESPVIPDPVVPGSYCAYVIDGYGCDTTICIDVLGVPTVTPNTVLCGDGSVTLEDISGTGSGTWSLDPMNTAGVSLTGTFGGTATATFSGASGLYTFIYTNDGCDAMTEVTVETGGSLPIVSNNGPLCIGDELMLMADFVAGASYAWTGPNGFTSSIQNPTLSNVTLANSGAYTLIITVGSCPSSPAITNLVINDIPATPVASSNSPVCEGEIINLTTDFVAGATYSWTGPGGFTSSDREPTISNASMANAGLYCVVVNVNGCESASGCTDVVVNTKPLQPNATNDGPACVGEDVTLMTDFVSGANYSWTGPNGFSSSDQNPVISSVTNTDAGTYCVVITINGCASDQGCTDIIISPTPAEPIASNNGPLCEENNLALTTDFIAGATYSWTGPGGFTSTDQNPVIFSVSTAEAGTYCVVVTVAGCQSPPGCTDVDINIKPATPIANNNGPLCAGDNLELTTDFVAGATYSWTGPLGFTSSDQNPILTNLTGIEAGTYCVIVTLDGCASEQGCTNVNINFPPGTPSVSSNSELCEGETLMLEGPTIAGASYAWTGPNGFTSNLEDPALSNISMLEAGSYCLVVTVNGCPSQPSCTDVIVNPLPSAPNVSSNSPICSGEDIMLFTDGIPGATYLWEGPTGIFFTDEDPVISGPAAIAGTYCLIVTIDGCDSPPSCTDVIINSTPIVPGVSSNSPLCEGDDLELMTNALTGATYAWTGPNGFTSTDQNPIISNVTLIHAGTYSLTVFVNGCESSSISTEVDVFPTPAQPTPVSNSPLCDGDDIELTVAEVTGANYIWTGPNGFTSFLQNPIISSATLADAGTYCVTISLNGCDSAPGCVDVTINAIPATPIANNNGPLCDGDDLELTTDEVIGASYEWSGPGGFTSADQNPIISAATSAESGMYCVIVTLNGCSSSQGCTDVVINPIPATPVVTNNGPICEGEDLELFTDPVAGATYSWTGPGGFTSSDQNPIIPMATPSDSGSYCLIVTVNGCISTESCMNVVVKPTPSTPIANNNGPICSGEDLELTTDAVTDATYTWTGPNGFTSMDQNPILPTATTAASGSYCVVVTVDGCASLEGCTNVEVKPTPATPIANNNSPICEGEDLELTTDAVTDATYAWTGPDGFMSTDQNPIVMAAAPAVSGTYCVVVTVDGCPSLEGCTDVEVRPTPATPVVNSNGPICGGEDIELTTDAVTDAVYAWTGPDGFMSMDQNPILMAATPTASGTYCVVVTVDGCPSLEGCIDVEVKPTPATPVANNNGPICEGEDLELNTDAVTDATYTWTGPDGFMSMDQNPILMAATPTASGTYCVVVTVDGCPSLEGCIDVEVKPTPATPVANNNGPICEGEDLELTTDAVTDAVYAWTGPDGFTSTDQNPIVLAATPAASGTYCVTVTVDGCASLEGCTDVLVKPTPATPVANNNGPICEGEDLELTTDAVTNAVYAWTGPDGFTSTDQNPILMVATPAASGTYCVTVTVDGCASLEGCTDVLVKPTPATPVANNNGPICEGENLELTTDAVTDATYAWTGPDGFTSTDQNPLLMTATPAASGTYCVVVTVDGCASLEGCTDVLVKPTPATPVANNNGPICEGEDLELTTDAVTDATYAWTGPGGFTSTDQNPTIIAATPAASGTYCVIVTVDGCASLEGCTDVLVKPTPATPIANNNGPICEGEDLELTTDAVTDATYAWTGPGGFTSTDQNPVLMAATPAASGTYCVVVTVDGCASLEGCTDVLIKPTPSTPVVNSNSPICEEDELMLTTDLVPGATYTWSGPNGFTSTDQNPTLTVSSVAESGNYCVRITIDGCESEEGCVMVTVKPKPVLPNINSNSPICEGEDLNLTADLVAGATYVWTGPNGFTSNLQNPVITLATPGNSGSYCLSVIVDGCESDEACMNVEVKPTPETPVASNNSPICESETLELNATLIPGGSYTWSGPNGFSSNDQNPIIVNATPLESGTYCVFVTIDGCASLESCTDVIIRPTPPTPIVNNNGPICEDETLELIADNIAGATYFWDGPGGFTSNDQNPVIFGADPSFSGTYCLFVEVDGCESAISCTDVVVNPTPTTPIASNNGPICVGEDVEFSATFIPGASYIWSGPNGFTSNQQNPILTNASIFDNGQYCVFVTIDGCQSELGCTDVSVKPNPVLPVVSNNGPICEFETIELTVANVNGASYAWSGPNGFVSVDQNPIITNATPLDNGQYCVIITVDGCDSELACTDVEVKPMPSAPILSNNGPICESENIELSASSISGASYAWTGPGGFSSSQQNPIITNADPSDSGDYCVRVTVDGCVSDEACTEVNVKPTPATPTVSNNGPICEGEDLLFNTDFVAGATYAWSGPGGFTSTDQNPVIPSAVPAESGTYCVVITVDGCESEAGCTDVLVKPTPVTPTANNNGPICEDETLELTTSTASGASYAWTGPGGFTSSDQNPILSNALPSQSGTYCVVITVDGCVSEAGCTDVLIKPTPATPVANNNGAICQGEDLLLNTDFVAGASYAWSGPGGFSSIDQNPVLASAGPAESGTYCVVITIDGCASEAGCTDVLVKPTPTTPTASNNGPICEDESLELSTNAVNGASYTWTGPGGFTSSDQNPILNDALPSQSGTYCVVITVDGCVSETGCTDVLIKPTPTTPTASNNGPICEGEDIELTTDAVSGAAYLWSGPGGFTSNVQNPSISNATPSESGSYCVIIIVDGCESESACTDVLVKPTPVTPLLSNNGPICEGESIELTADAVPSGSYSWSGPGGFTSTEQNPIISNASISESGSYCLIITIDGCESESVCTDVVVKPTPSTPIVSNNGPVCEGGIVELTTSAVNGGSYAWTGPNGFISAEQNPTISNATPNDNGEYCVIVTVDGCLSQAGCTDVLVLPTPETPTPSNNGPICEDESIQLSTDAVAGASYSWSGPGGFTSSDQNPIIPNANPSDNGSYCVIVTVDGCESLEGCTDVEVIPTPETPFASNNGPVCEGEDIQLSSTAVAGANYSWSGPSGYTSTDQNPILTAATPAANGTYCVSVIIDGCESEQSCTDVEISPELTAGPDQSILCEVLTDIIIVMDATPTSDGMWTTGSNPGSVNIDSPDSEITSITNITEPGTYIFIWSNGICTDEVEIEITEQPNAGDDQSVKCNLTGSAIMNAEGDGMWSIGSAIGNVDISDFSDPNAVVNNFENAGTVELIWTIGDCSDVVIITVDDDCECPIASNIIDGNPENYCGQSIERFIQGQDATPPGGDYQWQFRLNGAGQWNNVGVGKDYTTDMLDIGSYEFRRIYSIELPDCSDTSNLVIMNVLEQPMAGDDQLLECQDLSTLEIIMNGNGPGFWNQVSGPDNATIISNNDPMTIITVPVAGDYVFSFGDDDCSDEVMISITEAADAGPDQIVECFVTGSAVMSALANANGSWNWGTTPNGAAGPAFDMNDPNAVITGFSEPGNWELIWTVGDCSDSAIIMVGDDCDCPIQNNNIEQPSPSEFCGQSPMMTIIGAPADFGFGNGEYLWEYSFNMNEFEDAPPVNNEQNYTTMELGVGIHRFRRICTTTTLPICSSISNIVEIVVYAQPSAGQDQALECIDLPGGSITMNGSAPGTWSADATNPGAVNIVSPGDPTTEINDFPVSGTYCFTLTNEICEDQMCVSVSESVDAGPDQNVDCYVTGSAIMAAVSAGGTWSLGVIPGASAVDVSIITSPGSPNTTVNGFDVPGTYELIWTVGNCDDIVEIVVGDDCDCPISGNTIIQPIPAEYCDESPVLLIEGAEATPDGDYLWEYLDETSTWIPALGINDQRDYSTVNLTVGEHIFRRVYTIDTPPCETISNEVVITVIATPDAGIDQSLNCVELPATATMMASGQGTWSADSGNPSIVTIDDNSSPTTQVSDFSEPGDYILYYSNGNCSDEIIISITEAADAGADQSVNCFLTGTASLSAVGEGEWMYGTTTNDDRPPFNMENANTTISGFAGAGTYELIWTTEDGCTDMVMITVDDDCSCPIGNNAITQPDPNEFCAESDDVTVVGLDATPAGGTYIWEYSSNSIDFSTVGGNQRDYNTGLLGIGEHTFRRIYDLDSPDCSDTSNTVTIVVYTQPNAGMDQEIECVEVPATITMAGTGPGTWALASGNGSISILDEDSAATQVSGLESGEYIFTYTNGICTDDVRITVTEEADAGADQAFDCFETATAVMSASGSGTWAWQSTPGDEPALDSSNPNAAITGFMNPGEYILEWTNSDNCADVIVITVGADCDCPIANNIIDPPNDDNFCGNAENISITGSDPTPDGGIYLWEYSTDNMSFSPAPPPNDQRDYTTGLLSTGEHWFRRVYSVSDPIVCNDISNVIMLSVAENANAGPDQTVECFEDGVAIMGAVGSGTWSWNSTPTATIDVDDPNSEVTDFPSAGIYLLIWTTDDGCTDEVEITVGNDCACPIEDNTITQPDPNEFCGQSEEVLILGSEPTPSGGTYTWEYSEDGINYENAPGAFNGMNYTTGILDVGEYSFRRIYDIDSPIDCDDISNVVIIIVYPEAEAGPDQSVDCFEDGIATMAAEGDGEWSWISTEQAANITLNDPTTTVSGFPSAGTYVLQWTTDGICTDQVSIVVGDDCDCPIVDNSIIQPDPNEFCGQSEAITIMGSEAMPLGGSYLWEYSDDGGFSYAPANTPNDGMNYTTGELGVGEHRFRRVYAIDSPIECENTSNEIIIIVHEEANAGPDQIVDCFEDGIATMASEGDGEWSWISTEVAANITLNDPTTTVSGFPSAGTYVLQWTTDGICTDQVSIVVGDDCDCPIVDNSITQPDPNEFCGQSEAITIIGSDAMPLGGNYLWEYSGDGGFSYAPANTPNDGVNYTTEELGVGEHRFRRVYDIDSPLDCENISNVVLIIVYEDANAGSDQTINCFEDGNAIMAASGNGEWSWSPGLTADISPVDDPNAVVDNFPSAGEYTLIWTTEDGCSDEITIIVGDNCDCPIEDNTITQPDPNEFCGQSEAITILGLDAMPSGGNYHWEYSADGVNFNTAPGTFDEKDYTTDLLGVGEHRFRRMYDIDSPIDCENTSNVILITVYESANAGSDQTVTCFEDGSAAMAATGSGTWSWISSEQANTINLNDPNTTVSGFPSAGTYVLEWRTDDGCTDEVSIIVGDDCFECEIMNNEIEQPTPSDYCNQSPEMLIVGSVALPANGQYIWEYSFNGSVFSTASGQSNQENYTTTTLDPGEHRFRRIYRTQEDPLCEDISDIVVINVIGPIEAGEDQDLGCMNLEDAITTMGATGNGSWRQSNTNPGLVTISDINDANAEISDFAAPGTYTFIWSNSMCEDEMTIFIEEPKDAGQDRFVDCYVDGSVALSADGIGTWSVGSNNPGSVEFSSISDPNAILTNFTINGTYEFIWTVDGCDDSVIVEVDDNCPCLIETNAIIDDVSDVYCETTGELFITGDEAVPAGGTYQWQISIKGSTFSDAPGVNNTKDYDASNFGEGTYILRRLYSFAVDGVECSDLSNEIEFFVFDDKQNPGEIFFTPDPVCLGDTLLLEVNYNPNLTYSWDVMSGNGRVLYALDSMSMIIVESPGTITVSVTQYLEGCNDNAISTASEIEITVLASPRPNLGRDTTFCELKETFTINPGDFIYYEWQDGSNDQEFLIDQEGIYSVTVMDTMGCVGTDIVNIKSFCCEFAYPNIFKADSYGGNDVFKVTDIYDCVIEAELKIYDRWGNLVYIGDGLENWDGTFNGKFVEQGVYVFLYSYKAMDADRMEFEDSVSGDVTVLR